MCKRQKNPTNMLFAIDLKTFVRFVVVKEFYLKC